MTNEHLTDDELVDYVHHELDAAADARIHLHLSTCQACRAAIERETALTDQIRAMAAAETLDFPTSVAEHVRQAAQADAAQADAAQADAARPLALVRDSAPAPLPEDPPWERFQNSIRVLMRPMVFMPTLAAVVVLLQIIDVWVHSVTPAALIDAQALAQIHVIDAGRSAFADHASPWMLDAAAEDTRRALPEDAVPAAVVLTDGFEVAR